ncbi:hypothetical protein F5B20DRAFT_563385 [Whalleya microplaca]|nr:hypothetical protein F5B20DRAFT_563385 [Whalleya microplaca]
MSSLNITDADIPSLEGKVAIITGGGSGIGLAAVRLMAKKGARVYLLDLSPPDAETTPQPADGEPVLSENVTFAHCDTRSWTDLREAFQNCVSEFGRIDIAIANAGVSEEYDYFEDRVDESGELLEPGFGVADVNFRGVVNFIKLAVSQMRKQRKAGDMSGGSIVITSSATAYAPEHNLPVYSASKLATIGLVRALRSQLIVDDITINSVAPAATITKLLPRNLAQPLMAAGLPVSSAEFVGRALVYSATAKQTQRVAQYGKDSPVSNGSSRWNGRTILTLGDDYTELEQPHAGLQPYWFGWKNTELTKAQQAATDFRQF